MSASPAGLVGRPVSAVRSAALDTLKVGVILLVVLHHAMLAYCVYARFDAQDTLRSTAPIVDRQRWAGFDLMVDGNDIVLMPLMFFLSGLFVLPSLRRKGPRRYLADRVLRLGLPFAVAVVVIMPIAYYPTFAQTGAAVSFPAYWLGGFIRRVWPEGPAWFIWVLLVLDTLTVIAMGRWPGLVPLTAAAPDALLHRPAAGLALAVVLAALAYGPLLLAFGTWRWFTLGPFAVQASRILLYAVCFGGGVVLGAAGVGHPLFTRRGPFARAWPACALAALIAFVGVVALQAGAAGPARPAAWWLSFAALFVVCCILGSVAAIGAFLRHADRPNRWLQTLAACAFGIYLVHYPVVTWVQAALLNVAWPAIAKAVVTFGVAVGASWALVGGLRRNRLVRRVI